MKILGRKILVSRWVIMPSSGTESKWIRYSYIQNSPALIIWAKLRPGDDDSEMTMADQSLGWSQTRYFKCMKLIPRKFMSF